MQWAPSSRYNAGFTIVELLIVVVVIAILAAITVVSFNGIQQRAQQSAVQASVKDASTRILAYAAENSDRFPTSLSQIGSLGTNTSYTYIPSDASAPTNYCVSSASSANSQLSFGQIANGSISAGRCYTNVAMNPRLIGHTGFIAAGNGNASTTPGGGMVINQTGADAPAIDITITLPVQNVTYAVRFEGTNVAVRGTWDTSWSPINRQNGSYVGGVQSFTFDAGSSTVLRLRMGLPVGSSSGAQTTLDRIQVVQSNTPVTNYGTGGANWFWHGAENGSVSSGLLQL